MVRKADKIIRDTWAHSICQGNWHSMLRHNTCRGGGYMEDNVAVNGTSKVTPWRKMSEYATFPKNTSMNRSRAAGCELILEYSKCQPHCGWWTNSSFYPTMPRQSFLETLGFLQLLDEAATGEEIHGLQDIQISFNLTSTFTQEDISNNTESEFVAHNSHT